MHTHDWYKKLLSVGLDNMGIEFESDEIINIIPSVVEKVILPKIASILFFGFRSLNIRRLFSIEMYSAF